MFHIYAEYLDTLAPYQGCPKFEQVHLTTFWCVQKHAPYLQKYSNTLAPYQGCPKIWTKGSKFFPFKIDICSKGRQKLCWQMPTLNMYHFPLIQ